MPYLLVSLLSFLTKFSNPLLVPLHIPIPSSINRFQNWSSEGFIAEVSLFLNKQRLMRTSEIQVRQTSKQACNPVSQPASQPANKQPAALVLKYRFHLTENLISGRSNQPNSINRPKSSFLALSPHKLCS